MKPILCLLVFFVSTALAWSHPMPSSEVRLRLRERGIDARLTLPIIELKLGWQKPLPDSAEETVRLFGEDLKGYVREHVRPVAPDGRPWIVTVESVEPVVEKVPDVRVELRMTPPEGAPVDRLTLDYDVILHQLITHTAIVSIESDWRNGVVGGKPLLLGTLTDRAHVLAIDRSQGTLWRGFLGMLHLGMQHIAEGTDHLLFLLALLLPVPLLASKNRWAGPDDPRSCLKKILKVVTAFTLGHSITLLLGATGLVRLPSRPIEAAIALSIFVSALHAFRPIFPRREAVIAAGFGLVHGLAFASVLTEFGFGPATLALSILGFNLGIELVQLLVVGLTVPWLILLGRTKFYSPVRIGGATFAAVASLAWLAERLTGSSNRVAASVESLARHSGWILLALAAFSLLAAILVTKKEPKP